jgi:protein ERP2
MRLPGLLWVCVTTLVIGTIQAIELTFELPDSDTQCFYEDIEKDTDCTIEFQVVTGGQYDVDMILEGPGNTVLYKDTKKQYDSFNYKAQSTGVYKVCFSNEFSTFSHKIVYMDWQIGAEKPLMPAEKHLKAMTLMESEAQKIHEKLKVVDDYQTHHRLREATGRKNAEDLNERVQWWSIGQTCAIFLIGVGQVLVLRSFFSDRRAGMGHI